MARANSASITSRRKAVPPTMPKCLEGRKPTGTVSVPPGLDPHAYALIVQGDCLAPTIRDGEHVVCSPSAKVERGMFAAFFSKGVGRPAVKRLVTDLFLPATEGDECQFLITVEMDNPHRQFIIDPCKLDKAHAVIGVVRGGVFIALNSKVAA